LAEASGIHYKPGDPRPRGNRGRRFYGSNDLVPGEISGGLRFLRFSGAPHRLLALLGTQLYYSDLASVSGSFIPLGDVAGHQLATQQYKAEHVVYVGGPKNFVFDSGGGLREHGIPEQTAPVLTTAGGSGPAAGTYQYWVTGYDSETDVESAAVAGTSVTVGGAVTVTVHQPTLLGDRITHWRVYRSPEGTPFPSGNRLDSGTGIALTTLTFADTGLAAGVSYPAVATTFAGLDALVSRNSPPPRASFGFVLDDSLIQNNLDRPHELAYSFPGKFEAFPSEFFNEFKEDSPSAGLGFGTYGLVFCDSQIWRLNSVSRAQDAEFARGRLLDLISMNLGCPSPVGCCQFEMPQGPMGAFASRGGPMMSEGSGWDTVTDDVDWEATADMGTVGSWVFLNNPAMRWLELYFSPASGEHHSARMRFSYDPYHLKGRSGRWPALKVLGIDPIPWDGAAACLLNGRWEVLTLDAPRGRVYRENVGAVDESGGSALSAEVRSAAYPLGNLGMEGSCKKAWIDHEPSGDQRVSVVVTDYAAERDPISHQPTEIGVRFDSASVLTVEARGSEVDISLSTDQEDGQLILRGAALLAEPGGLEEGVRA
jgi:hypothetical protein